MDFFFELYKDLPKQGPGSDPITKKALSYIPNINQLKLIVDPKIPFYINMLYPSSCSLGMCLTCY